MNSVSKKKLLDMPVASFGGSMSRDIQSSLINASERDIVERQYSAAPGSLVPPKVEERPSSLASGIKDYTQPSFG